MPRSRVYEEQMISKREEIYECKVGILEAAREVHKIRARVEDQVRSGP